MGTFIIRRLLSSILVIWIIITCSFVIMRWAPGNPLQSEKGMSEATRDALAEKFNLDKPWYEAYVVRLSGIVTGMDFGPSMFNKDKQVNEIIAESAPISFQLGLQALFIAMLFGIPVGLLAGLKQNTWVDYTTMGGAMLGVSIPNFVLGPLLILVFALELGWFNTSGWESWSDSVLPSLTLGVYYTAYVARLTRGGMLEVIRQDYIRTARAKGLRESTVVTVHALKGAILPVVSFLGPAFAGMLTGSVVIETIFGIPGLGQHFVYGAFNRDYSLVLGTIVVYSSILVLLNVVVDVSYTFLDPRVRLS